MSLYFIFLFGLGEHHGPWQQVTYILVCMERKDATSSTPRSKRSSSSVESQARAAGTQHIFTREWEAEGVCPASNPAEEIIEYLEKELHTEIWTSSRVKPRPTQGSGPAHSSMAHEELESLAKQHVEERC
ncbi:hypothetical protein VIGAN_09124000 [Vigna angularis var. angularis]|uniref:Uncharacterized protein n=1 Tax=Vigna angularis var. angularis TaxID=157739 RepID=A0A0S3SY66_PHAAN|nr:hypothetical protein VIGAN_09124000 [Vigna angularis var. angularis]